MQNEQFIMTLIDRNMISSKQPIDGSTMCKDFINDHYRPALHASAPGTLVLPAVEN
jgi:hypothetical protein